MAPKQQNEREARQARERLRAYQARQTVHETKVKRRLRDNWVAGIAVVVVVALAVTAQLVFFAKPSKPSASASPSASTYTLPPKTLAGNRHWTGKLTINGIPLGVDLDGTAAPQAVSSTIELTQKGFYNGLSCHRLTDGGFYVLQCGDPKGDGTGGPGYSYGPIENAPKDNVYPAGTLAMARQGGNASSQGSQFFVVYKDTSIPSDAAGGYTVIGKITSGLDQLVTGVVDKGITPGTSPNDGKPKVATKIDTFTVQ